MSRSKKPRSVGHIEHQTGVRVELMFNNDDLTFFAKVGSDEFTGKSADEVRAAVIKFMDEQTKLEWIPVIEVQPSTVYRNRTMTVGIDIDRYYLANTADPNVIRMLAWGNYDVNREDHRWGVDRNKTDDMNRVMRSREFHHWHGDVKTKLPYHDDRSSSEYYFLPYSEETWAALEQIISGIEKMRNWLNELLGTDKGRAKLVDAGAKMARLLTDGK